MPGRWLLCRYTWQLQQSELDTERDDGALRCDVDDVDSLNQNLVL